MPQLIQAGGVVAGQVGPQLGSDGSQLAVRQAKDGSLVAQDAHARYQEAVMRGGVYVAANQAGKAVTNLNATATGFILSNPLGSPVNLVLLHVGVVQTSTAAASANAGVQLAINNNTAAAAVTHTTPLTVRNLLIGNTSVGYGLADDTATLPVAPVAIMDIWQPSVSATATTGIPPAVLLPLDGLVVLLPGTSVSLSALGAVSCATHMIWEEVRP